MFCKRIGTVLLAIGVAFTILSCSDTADPLDPLGPQYAKGGKPGAPTDPVPVELLEYFIYQNTAGENIVHILAKGDFPRANLNVVQDYFHDGIRNNDLFYEYTTAAPLPVGSAEDEALPEGAVWEWSNEAQAWHIDIPWNGETRYKIYQDPDDPESPPTATFDVEFPDFPQNGTEADPYTFDLRFQKENGDYIDYYRPKGIILGGTEVGSTTKVLGDNLFHESEEVHSYATYQGADDGHPVFIEDIILDESSFTCDLTTIRTGKGKDKVTQTVTEVTAGFQVILSPGKLGNEIADGWITVMFATGDPEVEDLTLHDTFQSTHGSDAWAAGWGASVRIPDEYSDDELRLAVVYVYATDLEHREVYDPSQNRDLTTPGGEFTWSTVLDPQLVEDGYEGPMLESFPIALTAPLDLNCGG